MTLIDWKNDQRFVKAVKKCVKDHRVEAKNLCQSAHQAFICIRKSTNKEALNIAFDRYYNTNATEFLRELVTLAKSSNNLKFRTEKKQKTIV
jgi:hypothetical protein